MKVRFLLYELRCEFYTSLPNFYLLFFSKLPILPHFPSGDCDSDDECAEGLVCFQRDPFDRVPGCNNGENERSNTDFCVPEGWTLAPIPTWEPTWLPTFSPTFDDLPRAPPPVSSPISFPDNVVDQDDDDIGDDDDVGVIDGLGDVVCGLIGVFC